MAKTLVKRIASLVQAMRNCEKTNNLEWLGKHEQAIQYLVKNYMPSGSGIDNGTSIDIASMPERLVFTTAFHHINDNGMYDGWTEHNVIVTPSLAFNFELRITGRNRDDIKDYLHDVFHMALEQAIDDSVLLAA